MFCWLSNVLLNVMSGCCCYELGEAGELKRSFLCLTAYAVGDTSYCDCLRPSNVVLVRTDTGIDPFLLPIGQKEFLVFSTSRLPRVFLFSLVTS